ncbi:ABC transporter ATP-binding protein [Rhizobiales bacterium TNE-4]|nr:ABC transporter ATP-binding protein [Rhizobiales bacterium TNE-4]MBV1827982.1 ABC transporter ATP-binding protein [Rhizobiales bacterium TNE-4]
MAERALLRLIGTGKSFAGRVVLRDVSFSLQQGEILSLIGPSGCGKTTILRMIAGLTEPDTGTIIRADALHAQGRIGYVFQDPTLMPWASAEANVALPLILQGKHRKEARLRAHAMLGKLGLGDFTRAAPHELSGGMRMRVALARALITDPALILMDEPFAALDEMTRYALNDEMLQLVRAHGTSLLFVTHSVAEATYLSDRVAVLSHRPGHVMAEFTMPWPAERAPTLRQDARFTAETARLSAALGRAMDDSDGVSAA